MWEEPKIDWAANNAVTSDDMNRIENDTNYLKDLLGVMI